jgi:LPXTG-motif cell wall-anchored protein
MPEGVSDLAVDEAAYGSGAEPELWMLALALSALAAVGLILRRRREAMARI